MESRVKYAVLQSLGRRTTEAIPGSGREDGPATAGKRASWVGYLGEFGETSDLNRFLTV